MLVLLVALFLSSGRLAAQPPEPGCASEKTLVRLHEDKDKKRRLLRIWADPNNLPFTNSKREGFENRIAELIAKELDADVEYTWHAQRRGFFRKSLKDGNADLVLGAPVGFDRALTTRPYYRSTYVFVTRKDRALTLGSLDDPLLKKLKIGVQLVGDDGCNPPAAHSLGLRGIIDNVVGFTVYGDYEEANPPARIVDAVSKGDLDTAIVWGPLAGYFAKRGATPLTVSPVRPEVDPPALRYAFSIALAVAKNNKALRDELNGVLDRRQAEIDRILDDYGVPRLPMLKKGPPGKKEP